MCPCSLVADGAEAKAPREMHVVLEVDHARGRWNAEVQEVRRCTRPRRGEEGEGEGMVGW